MVRASGPTIALPMRIELAGRFVLALATVALGAAAPCDGATAKRVGVEAGLRWAELDWNIAGGLDGSGPNVLSELTWSSLAILEIRGGGSLGFLEDRLVLQGELGAGVFIDGDVQDSDYKSDNRTDEYSRSRATNRDDYIGDASISIGHQWMGGMTRSMQQDVPLARRRMTLQVGLSWNEQRLRMTDGVQVLSRPDLDPQVAPEGPFDGLDSTYQARWIGPWLGAEFEHRLGGRWRVFAELELHLADYDAKANWNLREDFAHPLSFEQSADGQGTVIVLGWGGAEGKIAGLEVRLRAELWRTDPGVDTVFLADGGAAATRLNEANWRSALLSAGWRWRP